MSRDANLTQEALGAENCSELWPQHLEGNGTVVPEIAREIDGCHSAGANLAHDRVAPAERRVEPLDSID